MKSASAGSRERDPFAAARDDFIMSVVRDRSVTGPAVKVAVTLAIEFANRKQFQETGDLAAWPSQRTLHEKTAMYRSQIDRAVNALEAAGHLLVQRPEKRGAKHHNRYIMRVQNGRTDAAIDERDNGRISCANTKVDNGRTRAAFNCVTMAAPMRPLMAAPVGPNSYEEPLNGAGALSRPSPNAPELPDSNLIDDADIGPTALDAPVPESLDPDSWRSDPQFAAGDSLRDSGAHRRAPSPAPEDLERAELEEMERLTEAAASELEQIHPDADSFGRPYIDDLVDGFMGEDPDALHRFRRKTSVLLADTASEAGLNRAELHASVIERHVKIYWGPMSAKAKAKEFLEAFCPDFAARTLCVEAVND